MIKRRKLASPNEYDSFSKVKYEKQGQRLFNNDENAENSYIDNSNLEDNIQILRKNINKDESSGTDQDHINYSITSSLDKRYQKLRARFNIENICKQSFRNCNFIGYSNLDNDALDPWNR